MIAGLHCALRTPEADGKGDGDALSPLVILPGLLGSAQQLKPIITALGKRRPVLCVEALGGVRGESPDARAPERPYAWEQQADRLIAVLDELALPCVDVVGISIGGIWAQHALLRHPSRFGRAVLCTTSARLAARERCIMEGLLAVVRSSVSDLDVVRCLIGWLFSPAFLSRPGAVAVVEMFLTRQPLPRRGMEGQVEAMLGHQLHDELAALTQVKKVIAGEHDFLMPPSVNAKLARAVGGAPLDVVPGSGHSPWVEAQAAFIAAVQAPLEGPPT